MSTRSKRLNKTLALAQDQSKDVYFSTEHVLDLFALNLERARIEQQISAVLQSYNHPADANFLVDPKGRWLGFRPAEMKPEVPAAQE